MSNAVEHMTADLARLIERMRYEYEITYAELVGVLEITKADLIVEAQEVSEDEK